MRTGSTIPPHDVLGVLLILLVEAIGVALVGGLAVAGVVIIVDDVGLRILWLLLVAFLHHGDLLAELAANVLLPLPCSRVLAAGHFFINCLAVLQLLLRDGRAIELASLAVVLGEGILLPTLREKLDLLRLAGGCAAVLRLHVIDPNLLRALTRRKECREIVLLFEGRSARRCVLGAATVPGEDVGVDAIAVRILIKLVSLIDARHHEVGVAPL